jgi:RNA polymerase sigma-70 factor, ECF subfamily
MTSARLNSHTDEQLFTMIKQGEEKGLEILFRKYYTLLCNKIFSITQDKDISEDIIQQLFIKVWESREKIEIQSSVIAYLSTSGRNMALNWLKSNQRKNNNENSLAGITNEEDHSSQVILEGKELQLLIHQAIDNLPEKRKEIFKLSRFEMLTYKEIAERLDISVKTVEAQMGKALSTLREFLSEYRETGIFILFLLLWG